MAQALNASFMLLGLIRIQGYRNGRGGSGRRPKLAWDRTQPRAQADGHAPRARHSARERKQLAAKRRVPPLATVPPISSPAWAAQATRHHLAQPERTAGLA